MTLRLEHWAQVTHCTGIRIDSEKLYNSENNLSLMYQKYLISVSQIW